MMMMMTMAGKVAIEWQTSRPMGGRIAVFLQAPPQELRSWGETGILPVTLALREHGDFSHFNDGSLLPHPNIVPHPLHSTPGPDAPTPAPSRAHALHTEARLQLLRRNSRSRRSFSFQAPGVQGLLNRH
ncbi:uncharacterized protein CDAR_223391 [Caerostris darwini]|uniref:Uncharacterized protein n=1 Tax=Caerostris darwini TaxID=1538125 RepID=A0AAV4W6B4_9ARAC|nr:uncharacterized protein CDAR_223391 [Caerostris darwini]